MLNGNEPTECRISEAAMDGLAGERGSQMTDRLAQFLAHRDAIEQIASDLFDASPNVKGYVIRIFTKHVTERRAVPDSIVTASHLGHLKQDGLSVTNALNGTEIQTLTE
jgi:hypothetical protein